MKTIGRRFCYHFIGFLLLGVMMVSCSQKMVVPQPSIGTSHSILVIPFKAPPAAIMSGGTTAGFVLGGFAGYGLVHASTKEEREKIADTLNTQSGRWEPILVIAQECSDLIRTSTHLRVENISIAEPRPMPGLDAQAKDAKRFTAESQVYAAGSPWSRAGNQMLGNSDYVSYRKEYPQASADWALEVFSTYMWVTGMDKISFNVYLKVVDMSSGQKVALDYAYDEFGISLGKDISRFELFEGEFRGGARQLCAKIVSNMGLARTAK